MSLVVWLTGMSGAGKTTLAELVAARLRSQGRKVEILDGDEVRRVMAPGLGFSREDREVSVARLGWLAALVTRLDGVAVVAAISPYAKSRLLARQQVGVRFVEVHVHCPLDVLEKRDTKGLYARARAGQLSNLTGVSDPYEPPTAAEVMVDTSLESAAESAARILAVLEC